jgi:DNA-binding NarL/FixJ family response regulator
MASRVYVCDQNPRMRQLIAERLQGHGTIVGESGMAKEAVSECAELEPDMVVLDYRTTIGAIDETVASIKEQCPSAVVVVHTGVPRYLIEDQVQAAGAVYSSKSEPEHLIALVSSLKPALGEAASRGS